LLITENKHVGTFRANHLHPDESVRFHWQNDGKGKGQTA